MNNNNVYNISIYKECFLLVYFFSIFIVNTGGFSTRLNSKRYIPPDYSDIIPKPKWSPVTYHIVFNSTEEFERFRERTNNIQNNLINETYNSVTSLIRLYHDYKENEHKHGGDLTLFYRDYKPIVDDEHRNCVGMTIKLKKQLTEELKHEIEDIDKHLFYVAGEMLVSKYNDIFQRAELRGDERWKHAALGLKFYLNDRLGYLFLDQSFGIPTVTVMKDEKYPHDAKFKSHNKYNSDIFTYELTDNGFIKFDRKTEYFLDPDIKKQTGGFYVAKAYDSILDLTEKRALIKQKRTIIKRQPVSLRRDSDADFLLNNNSAIFEVYKMGKYFPQVRDLKIDLTKVLLNQSNLGIEKDGLEKLAKYNNIYGFREGKLLEIIRNVSRLAQDKDFIEQLRVLDDEINYSIPKEYYKSSPEYDDEGSKSGEMLYSEFVHYIQNLTSEEAMAFHEQQKQEMNTKYPRTSPQWSNTCGNY